MRRLTLLCALSLLLPACSGLRGQAKFEPLPDAPPLTPRANNCHVEVLELGKTFSRDHQVVGTLLMELSRDDLASEGGRGVTERLRAAACERGLYVVRDIKAYPNVATGAVLYEAKGAVLLDDEGRPIGSAALVVDDAGIAADGAMP